MQHTCPQFLSMQAAARRTISEYVAIGWFAWLKAIFWIASSGTESTAPGKPQMDPQITRPPRIAIGVMFREDPNIIGSSTCSSER